MKKVKIPRDAWVMTGLMLTVGAIITVFGIVYKQDFWRMIPLYVSLVIALLQSRVNRFAPLIGGINSVLYALVYFYYTLYASCLYALLVSAPLQIITFIRWNKNSYKESTVFRSLTNKQRFLITGGFVVCWIALYIILCSLGSDYLLLDNTVTLLGILSTVLMMLSYIEYTVLTIISSAASLVLYIVMIKNNPEQITYFVYTAYGTLCSVIALFSARKNYIAQQNSNIIK